jgi:hypothetical protein
MSKKIGIILVNYKDYAIKFLETCRDSLRSQDYPAELIHVYIVDNASTPESLAYLKDNYPEAQILSRPDGNYAAANNLGFKQAIIDGCEYLVTVNMDTEMAPGWLKELVLALDNNPEAGIAQSKILLYSKNEEERANKKINSLGNIFHFLGFGFTSAYCEPDREISGYPEIKGYASGCAFIIRREVFQKIGGYNEEFYMYHDDVEISFKTKLSGYKIILAPKSIIYHKYEFSRSVKMIYYMERNRYLTMLIFYPAPLLFLVAFPAAVMACGMIFYALLGGWSKEKIKIFAYFLKKENYVKIREERKNIKKLSIGSFLDIAKSFSGRIEFREIANPILKYIVNPLLDLYWRMIKLFL